MTTEPTGLAEIRRNVVSPTPEEATLPPLIAALDAAQAEYERTREAHNVAIDARAKAARAAFMAKGDNHVSLPVIGQHLGGISKASVRDLIRAFNRARGRGTTVKLPGRQPQ